MDFVSGALGGTIVAAVVGAVATVFTKRFFTRQDRLEERLERLEKERISQLEQDLKEHVKADRSQEILARLESLTGAVNKLTDATMRSLELNSRQEAHLVGHDEFLRSIDRVLQDHIKQHNFRR